MIYNHLLGFVLFSYTKIDIQLKTFQHSQECWNVFNMASIIRQRFYY